MNFLTINISVQSSARTNTVCGDHFNEVVSLQTHTFSHKMGNGKESQYNRPINARKTNWLLEETLSYKAHSRVKDMSDISRKQQIH